MRLEARVLEGDKQTKALVPLATFIEFKKVHGVPLNECIPFIDEATGRVVREGRDFAEWAPWVAWHTATKRLDEGRQFEEWAEAVEWIHLATAENELDPSGGEDTRTPESSPASSSTATAGRTSSTSTRTSKQRSGRK